MVKVLLKSHRRRVPLLTDRELYRRLHFLARYNNPDAMLMVRANRVMLKK
jgi:hypothetical protein